MGGAVGVRGGVSFVGGPRAGGELGGGDGGDRGEAKLAKRGVQRRGKHLKRRQGGRGDHEAGAGRDRRRARQRGRKRARPQATREGPVDDAPPVVRPAQGEAGQVGAGVDGVAKEGGGDSGRARRRARQRAEKKREGGVGRPPAPTLHTHSLVCSPLLLSHRGPASRPATPTRSVAAPLSSTSAGPWSPMAAGPRGGRPGGRAPGRRGAGAGVAAAGCDGDRLAPHSSARPRPGPTPRSRARRPQRLPAAHRPRAERGSRLSALMPACARRR